MAFPVVPGPRPSAAERWVRRHYPETETLILTPHDRDVFRSIRLTASLAEMEEAGAAGFLTKGEGLPNIVAAVRRAARGEVLYTQKRLERARRWREEVGARWESLTRREREVLRLVVEGLSNAAIAETLCVTEKTVEYHVTNMLAKLGLESRLEAAAWVCEHLPDDLWDFHRIETVDFHRDRPPKTWHTRLVGGRSAEYVNYRRSANA